VHHLSREAYDVIDAPEKVGNTGTKWKEVGNTTFFEPYRDKDGNIEYDKEVSLSFTFFPLNDDGTTNFDGYFSITVNNDKPARIEVHVTDKLTV
jgi:hypothetical protein